MSYPRELSDTARRSIAVQIAAIVPREEREAYAYADTRTELGEDLPEYMLSLQSVIDGAGTSDAIRYTGQWHHQVRIDGEAMHFAVSEQVSPDTWNVRAFWSSDIPARVHEALVWIDEHFKDADTAAVLVAPAFQVYAVLIGRPNELSAEELGVVLASQPEQRRLEYRRRYNLRDFIEALRGETPSNPLPRDEGSEGP